MDMALRGNVGYLWGSETAQMTSRQIVRWFTALLLVLGIGAVSQLAHAQAVTNGGHHAVVLHPGVSVPHPAADQRRVAPAQRWDTTLFISPGALKPLSGPPRLLRASESSIVATDDHGGIASFDKRGKLRWSTVVKDATPVRDAAISGDSVWLLRRNDQLAYVVGPDGHVARTVQFRRTGELGLIAPLGSGAIIVCQIFELPPCLETDAAGAIRTPVALQWKDFGRLHPLMRSALLGSESRAGRWVFVLSQGDGWFAYDNATPMPFIGHFIEHAEFPDVISDTAGSQITSELARFNFMTLGVAVADSVVSVLFKSADRCRGAWAELHTTGIVAGSGAPAVPPRLGLGSFGMRQHRRRRRYTGSLADLKWMPAATAHRPINTPRHDRP